MKRLLIHFLCAFIVLITFEAFTVEPSPVKEKQKAVHVDHHQLNDTLLPLEVVKALGVRDTRTAEATPTNSMHLLKRLDNGATTPRVDKEEVIPLRNSLRDSLKPKKIPKLE